MATLKQIKDKKNSISSINKITKAMELVSSAKSQKSIKNLKEYSDYFDKVLGIIGEISKDISQRETHNGVYWILVLSDLGLAGGYNHNLLKEFTKNFNKENDKAIVIGNKGIALARKNKDKIEWFSLQELFTSENGLNEIITRIKTNYYDNELEVKIIHSHFVSRMEFEPKIHSIFPMEKIEIISTKEESKDESKLMPVTTFEPEKEILIKELEDIYLTSFLVYIYRNSQASENTSRKIAMEAATKNGDELIEKLNIQYNRGRQAKITQEISEIIGGAESLG